jgi:glycosyltransferase involved in cell wall biosynthesis
MRILNVSATYQPFAEFGGPPVKVKALSEGLVRRGHSVTVLTVDWGLEKSLEKFRESSIPDRSPFGWRREVNGVQSIYLPTWLRYRATSWNPAVSRYCSARLNNFDVVHIFGLYDLLGPAVAKTCRKQNKKYVIEPIGMFVPIVRNMRLKKFYHWIWGRQLFGGASRVIATSEQEIEELSAGGIPRSKIALRRNGVTLPDSWPERGEFRRAHGIRKESKLVLFLGRLSKKKSPELLLEAFAGLPAEFAGFPPMLVFAGPDESGMQAELKSAADKAGVRGRVKFVGTVFGEQKWAAYRDADVFVLPSQNENFGNSAAEAMAAGTPVIVSKNCGIAPLLAGKAGIVTEHNSAAVETALHQMLGDETFRARMLAGCGAVTAQLGWEGPVYEMETIYGELATAR